MIFQTLKLLIVDDDEDDFFLTSDYLKEIPNKTFDITWANSFNEGIKKLKEDNFDLCFFDFLLGAKTGIDLLKMALERGVSCPIVLLTGKDDQHIDLEAMRLGAMDYLVKSELDSEKLNRCIRYSLERAESIRRLRESETRLRSIFEHMKDAVLLKRSNDFIFYYNTAALTLLGYNENDIKQLHFRRLFVESTDYERYLQALEHRSESIDHFDALVLRKNNERTPCSLHMSKHTDSEGKPYTMIVLQDITSRKRLERERLLSEKAASTARLVRTLAHEVRNPLTNIHLSLDQLEPDLVDEELRLFTDIIRRNSHRINGLITELLNSFKAQETVLKQVSIHKILESTLAEAIDRINLKKITLIKAFGSERFLELDESKIKIALLNLVINAIEAMPSETGVLTITTDVTDEKCFVQVKDNGPGISPENLNRLFEPYFTSKTNGLGLGLAATLTILHSHHATVEVESELKKGTTFTVLFPLTKQAPHLAEPIA